MNIKKELAVFLAVCLSLPCLSQPRITQEHKDRAAQIVSQMTLDEKINYIAGHRSWHVRGVERLGLPMVRMQDGPQGIRDKYREEKKSTLYPSGMAVAATWDRDLVNKMGVSLGRDARSRGVHVVLGPGANIYRSPLCGRNFEYFGEDPYLAGEIATDYIAGVQSQGVMTCIKHFAGNNQEYARHSVSSDIDERTLHEIYFPAFEKAVRKAGVGAVMTSYNLLNGVHSSESKYLNYDVLRDFWGYEGMVMSDWRSCYSPLNVATYGVDIEMPKPECMTPESIRQLLEGNMLEQEYIDRKCRHIVQTILAFGFDARPQKDESIPLNDPKSDSVALEVARSAVVMLKNQDGFLPFVKGDVFVCGPNADRIVAGGGSGFVDPYVSTTVAEGMASMGRKIRVAKDIGEADCVVVCLGFDKETEREDRDRTFALPDSQVEFLRDVLKRNQNVVVVINAGGGVEMEPWMQDVKAVLMAWYPGQQGGLAVSEIITGKVSPSGKLPISIERRLEDNPSSANYRPNVPRIRNEKQNPYSRVEYREGIFVGYRGYDRSGVKPLFPFGYGLSYTSFEYSDMKVSEDDGEYVVSFTVSNVGKMAGAEVAQVYVTDQECSRIRPQKELKGFDKVYLCPGESRTVSVRLGEEAFRFYDPGLHDWVVESGKFIISVGASSADMRLNCELYVDNDKF